nr:rhomboid family intramembrane serine protease [Deinobacterium chartae]
MLTSMFLHSGWGHLLGNMWFLFIFGDNVEDRLGHFSFLVFYLVGGMIAALAQAFLGGDPSVPMIGASGAISAVLGAYLLFYPRARILTLLFIVIFFTLIRVPALFYLPYWALVQLLSSFSGQSNVAFVAHLGGFIGGLLIAVLWPKRRERITY